MSEMFERVAKAIFVAADDATNTWPTPSHPECQRMARAAIAAMREPTESMENEAADTDAAEKRDYRRIWIAMIDAILSEGGE